MKWGNTEDFEAGARTECPLETEKLACLLFPTLVLSGPNSFAYITGIDVNFPPSDGRRYAKENRDRRNRGGGGGKREGGKERKGREIGIIPGDGGWGSIIKKDSSKVGKEPLGSCVLRLE